MVSFLLLLEYEFQSTLPGWGATTGPSTTTQSNLFQSTLPGWGATAADLARRLRQ